MKQRGFATILIAVLIAMILLAGTWHYMTTHQFQKPTGALSSGFPALTSTATSHFTVDNVFSFIPPTGWTQTNTADIQNFSDAEGNPVSLDFQWEDEPNVMGAFGSGAGLLGHLKNGFGDYYSQIDTDTLASIGVVLHLPGRDMLYDAEFDFGSHQYSDAEYAEAVDLINSISPLPSAMISRTYHFIAGPFSIDTSTPTISGPYHGEGSFGITIVPGIQSWGRTGNFSSFPDASWVDASDHGGTLSLSAPGAISGIFSDDVGTVLPSGVYSVGLYIYQNIYDPYYKGDTLPTLVATGTLVVK